MMWLSKSRIAPAGGVRPPIQMARNLRRRSNFGISTACSRPTARSSATASRLMAAGPAPASTAARMAAADGRSNTGAACCRSSPTTLLNAPNFVDALTGLPHSRRADVAPLLPASAYHARLDIPEQLARAGAHGLRHADALGEDDRLVAVPVGP